jgi:hypothetical protein
MLLKQYFMRHSALLFWRLVEILAIIAFVPTYHHCRGLTNSKAVKAGGYMVFGYLSLEMALLLQSQDAKRKQ